MSQIRHTSQQMYQPCTNLKLGGVVERPADPVRAVVAVGRAGEGGVGGGEVTAPPQGHLADQQQASASGFAWSGVQGARAEQHVVIYIYIYIHT